MGLPMFREPDDDAVVAEGAAAKLDRAAAARRSTIRREPTIRPGRYHTSAAIDRLREGRRESIRQRARTLVTEEEREANQQIAELEAELERLRSIRLRDRARLDREISRNRRESADRPDHLLLHDAMDLLDHSRIIYRDDDENTDAITRAASPARQTVSQHLPRPPRESNLRFEVGVTRSASHSPRMVPLLSPPMSSESGNRGRNIPDGPLPFDEDEEGAIASEFLLPRGSYRSSRHGTFGGGDDDLPALETPPPETWEASYPPLRRVGHISPRPLGASRVDGLGDRRRSPSPVSDNHEEETWANLLTTMGDNGSSTVTSFASTRSDSAARSRSSQNTATSFGEIGQADDSCDLDLPSGITEEDVRQIRDQHRRMRRQEPDGPLMTGERGLREHRARGSSEHWERRTRRLDLGMFQNILERMQRREEIPDEWWAAVGLTPDVVRNARD